MISAEDFNLLQEQLIELKRHKYESSEREKKYQNEIKSLRDQVDSHHESGHPVEPTTPKKSSLFSNVLTNITKDKGKLSDLQEENEILKKTIQQNTLVHQEQSQALQHNVKSLFETNSGLEQEIVSMKRDIELYTAKIEDQQTTIRKLQFDIAESYSSASAVAVSNGSSSCTTPEIVSSGAGTSVELMVNSMIEALAEGKEMADDEREELKSKFFKRLSISESPSTNSPKEIIFHPLGEPEYNPDEEKERTKLRETIKGLMEQIKETDQKYRALQQQIKESQQSLEENQGTISQWQEKHKSAEINRVKIEEKLSADIRSLREEIQSLHEQDSQKDSQIKSLNSTITQLSNSSKLDHESFDRALHDKIEEIRNQKLNYERQISDITDKANIYKMSRDEYLEQYNKASQDLLEKDRAYEATLSKLNKLEQEHLDQSQVLESTKSELSETKANLDQAEAKAKKFEEKLVMERSSFDSLNEKFNLLNNEHRENEKSSVDLGKSYKELEEKFEERSKSFDQLSADHSGLTKDLEEKSNQFSQLEAEFYNLKEEHNKSLERLTELESVLVENNENKQALEQVRKEIQEKSEQLDRLIPELEELKALKESSESEIKTLKTQLEDSETEKKIASRQSTKMIKDLKDLLAKERESVSLSNSSSLLPTIPLSASHNSLSTLAASGNSFPTSNTISNLSLGGSVSVPGSPLLTKSSSSVSLSKTPQLTPVKHTGKSMHQRSHSVNPNLSMNSDLPPVNIEQLKHDFQLMGKKLGEMGNEKYKLEEKIRTLEGNVSTLNLELEKKTQVVRFYISKTQLGKATTDDEKSKRLKGGVLGSFWRNNSDPNKVAEIVEKMDIVLQENILKNIQLSNDIELLGDESVKLKNENIKLKSLLKDNNVQIDE